MKPATRSKVQLRTIVMVLGLLLPTLSLVPLGSVWLWQNGYLLYWALFSAAIVSLTYFVLNRFLKFNSHPIRKKAEPDASSKPDKNLTPIEASAWAEVENIAKNVDIEGLTSRDAFIELGLQTIRAVSKKMHPDVADPLWQFTVPEACAILEQVSRRMGRFASDNIPLGDRLTVAQALAVYEWRGAIGVAEKAYDAWRLIRLANPLTAATHELRERFSKQMIEFGRTHVTQRIAETYVKEIGQAAIDLYSGRLRFSSEDMETTLSNATASDNQDMAQRTQEPLRILLAGQTGAGKSSLLNALANDVHASVNPIPTTSTFAAFELCRPEFPATHVIDSPGLSELNLESERLTAEALKADLILWVLAANRADRELDRKVLSLIRGSFLTLSKRHAPPVIFVVSQIDRLRPFGEWAPPYDLAKDARPKAIAIRSTMEAVQADLSVSSADIIPVCLDAATPYNIEGIWDRVMAVLPDVKRARLARQYDDARGRWNWRKVLTQASGASRTLGSVFRR